MSIFKAKSILQYKDTMVLSEINSFFTSTEKVIEYIFSFIQFRFVRIFQYKP